MNRITTNQIEFLAEQEMILIQPFFHLKDNNGYFNCIGGDYGPFNPSIQCKVPLWLALAFKRMQKCRIVQPDWLSIDYLSETLAKEKEFQAFVDLPFHYMEIGALVCRAAAEDINDLGRIRALLEDIQNVRQDKIRNGLQGIAADVQTGGTAHAVKMNNVGAMEIHSVRQFMIQSLNQFYSFSSSGETENMLEANYSQPSQDQEAAGTYGLSPAPGASSRLRKHRG